MEIWGDFSWANFNRLKKAGYDITFWTCPTAKYEPKWGDEYNAVLINNFQSVTYFVTITKGRYTYRYRCGASEDAGQRFAKN